MNTSGDVRNRGFLDTKEPVDDAKKEREDNLVTSMRSPDLHCSQLDQASGMLSARRAEMRWNCDDIAKLKLARRRLRYNIL